MNFSFEETPDSRRQSYNPPGITLIYKAVGETSNSVVMAYALQGSPPVVFASGVACYRQNVDLDPAGWAQFLVTIPYAPKNRKPTSNIPSGSSTFSFDTTGATIHIKAAKEHIASYPPGSPNNPHKCAIGISKNGDVEGADIVAPALKMTYTFKHPQGVVNENFARATSGITGRTNRNTFRGFPQGELLFLGGTGSDGSEAEAEVAYHMAAATNETGMTIGDIVGISKKGHHLIWVEFKDDEDDGHATSPPKRVHIERAYDEVDFGAAFGWS